MRKTILTFCSLFTPLLADNLTDTSDVENYTQHSQLPWTWATGSIHKYDFSGHLRVLDVGSGDGKITAWMQENKLPQGIVVGIDISPAMLSHATTHYPPQHYPQLFFMQGDATNLPFLNQFDLVTSFCCMHWISDQKLVLRNIRSALMPLGKTLIVIPAKNEKSHMAIAQKLIQSKRWKESFVGFIDPRKYYTPSEFSQMLLEENLTPVSVQEIPTTIVYDNLDDFKSFLRLISQYVQFLPLDKQDEFMDDLIEQLIVFHTLDEDGKLNYEITKLEAIAERNEQE